MEILHTLKSDRRVKTSKARVVVVVVVVLSSGLQVQVQTESGARTAPGRQKRGMLCQRVNPDRMVLARARTPRSIHGHGHFHRGIRERMQHTVWGQGGEDKIDLLC